MRHHIKRAITWCDIIYRAPLNLFKKYAYIYGITIAGLEKTKADQLQLPNNYNFLVDKYDIDNLSSILGKINYDIIVDINLKSFAPNSSASLNASSSSPLRPTHPGGSSMILVSVI